MPPKSTPSSQNQPSISSFFIKPVTTPKRTFDAANTDAGPSQGGSDSRDGMNGIRGSSVVRTLSKPVKKSGSAASITDLTDSPPKQKRARLRSPSPALDERGAAKASDDGEDEEEMFQEVKKEDIEGTGRSFSTGPSGSSSLETFRSRLQQSTLSASSRRAAAIQDALIQPLPSSSSAYTQPSRNLPTIIKPKSQVQARAAAALSKFSLPPQAIPTLTSGVAFGDFSIKPASSSNGILAEGLDNETEGGPVPALPQVDEAKRKKRHQEWQRRMVQPGGLVPRRRSLALDEADAEAARALLGGADAEDGVSDGGMGGSKGEAEGEAEDFEILDEEGDAGPKSKTKSKKADAKGKAKPPTKGKGKKVEELGPSGLPYTPLEKQYMAIHASHPDVLLLTEVGYKFKFHGEDAKIASKELGIACFPQRNFYSASIPVHRLMVHVKKLVAQGYKVGVVRQTETAALKAAGDNRNKPFERELTNLYTAATYVDDSSVSDGNVDADFFADSAGGSARSQAFVGISERNAGGMGSDERVEMSVVSVDCASGVVVYDTFVDGHLRNELETRLAHLQPAEILLPQIPMSKPTEKMLAHFAGYSRSSTGSRIRVERASFPKTYEQAFDLISDAISGSGGKDKSTTRSQARVGKTGSASPEVMDLDSDNENDGRATIGINDGLLSTRTDGVAGCENRHVEALASMDKLLWPVLAAMVTHLQRFKLEEPLLHTADFAKFSAVAHMIMSANTLSNLEIFRNQTDYTEKGSLIWLLDQTRTRMGRRILREWVGRPLTDIRLLEKRVNAVEELVNESTVTLEKLKGLLKNMPDLQRGLARIQYHKANPGEVATLLIAFQRIGNEFNEATSLPSSDLLTDIVKSFPRIKSIADRFLSDINIREARTEAAANMFTNPEKFPAIQEAKDCIAVCQYELDAHLKELRKSLKKPTLAYVTVAGIDNLIEMRLKESVPAQWVKISATKTVARYHTPVVLEKSKELEQGKETLRAAGNEAFLAWQTEICEVGYDLLRDAVLKLAIFDCLLSLAKVAILPGYVKPNFVERSELRLEGARHPMAESYAEMEYVPNDICFTENGQRVVILTSPNLAGKSSVIRTAALVLVLAQIGSFVPCSSATLGMHDAIYTRMGAMDRLAQGQSTFMVEMVETAEILRQASKRSLCLLDELGRGTSTFDGMAVAYGVLDQMTKIGCNTFFTTHFPVVAKEMARLHPTDIGNYHMSYEEMEGPDGLPEIVFLYKLVPGLASRSFGVWAARLAGVPMAVLLHAQRLGQEYAQRVPRGSAKRVMSESVEASGLTKANVDNLLHALRSLRD